MAKRPNCVSMPIFVAIGPTVAEIWRFFISQDGGRRHLGFLKFPIFNGPTTQEVRTAYSAKFCWNRRTNRSNCYRDMAIFRLFQDGGCSPSWICHAPWCACSDHLWRAFGGLYGCAKFGWNHCSSFDNMHVFQIREFGLKTAIQVPKIGFWGT